MHIKKLKHFKTSQGYDGVGLILVHNGIVHVAKLILLRLNNNSRMIILLLNYTLVFFPINLLQLAVPFDASLPASKCLQDQPGRYCELWCCGCVYGNFIVYISTAN